jgi:hypothetical protein
MKVKYEMLGFRAHPRNSYRPPLPRDVNRASKAGVGDIGGIDSRTQQFAHRPIKDPLMTH